MPLLNRDSISDAASLVEIFLPNQEDRNALTAFLTEAISFADSIKPGNWSLNLDKKGQFLRFNTGQVYCIDLYSNATLVLCDRNILPDDTGVSESPVSYLGKKDNKIAKEENPSDLKDLLSKVNGSIGVIIPNDIISEYIGLYKAANESFIRNALKTRILPSMSAANSEGAIKYLFSKYEEFQKNDEIIDSISIIQQKEKKEQERARKMSSEERMKELKRMPSFPQQISVRQTVFLRNQLVVVERLARANGICDHCGKPAPFIRDSDGTPYLEVHHIIFLAEGGEDTLENTVALCPNCHRKAHYGIDIIE